MEKRDNAPKAGAYALFADIAKAYDQVWRKGLYLTLYSVGVRGKMWKVIQAWLNNASATTSWNGVDGPKVCLKQGFRQGCVLSPILYCLFSTTFIMARPVNEILTNIPQTYKPVVAELYSHGIAPATVSKGMYGVAPHASPQKTGAKMLK